MLQIYASLSTQYARSAGDSPSAFLRKHSQPENGFPLPRHPLHSLFSLFNPNHRSTNINTTTAPIKEKLMWILEAKSSWKTLFIFSQYKDWLDHEEKSFPFSAKFSVAHISLIVIKAVSDP